MHVIKQFAAERIRERIALGQHVAEQLAAHQADLLDQAVDADGKRFRPSEHGIDLGFLGRQLLPLGGNDVGFLLAFGRCRSELLEPGVYLRQARPERDRAGKQLARKLLELQPDLDELGVLVAAGGDPFFELVGLPGVSVDEATLLVDKRVACIADALRKAPDGKAATTRKETIRARQRRTNGMISQRLGWTDFGSPLRGP